MKIAVEGCGHGELDKIYETIQFLEQREGIKVDLLLCCGDFQSVRNESDLECMAVPKKYRTMNTFYKYYGGEKTAPILTIFIGGNHEASNYLAELPYGGWVCPNIYYMGYANVLNYGGVRIGGMSGIYKPRDYRKGHCERPPYTPDAIRSAYHIRNLEVFRFKQIKQPMDIMMSHDWPKGVYRHGDKEALIRRKPFMRDEVLQNTLGSAPTEEVLYSMKPDYWFSAHLHVKFAAVVKHKISEDGEEKHTKFLSLDKCLPKRDFLQVVEISHKTEHPYQLTYDPEWLAILKETDHLLSTSSQLNHMPARYFSNRFEYSVTLEQISAVRTAFGDTLKVPLNFVKTVPVHNPMKPIRNAQQPNMCINPQTTELCTKLGITDPCAILVGNSNTGTNVRLPVGSDQGEVSISEGEDDATYTSDMFDSSTTNPDEISLDEGDSDSQTESNKNKDMFDSSTTNPDEISLNKGDGCSQTESMENKAESTDASVSPFRGRLSLSLPPVKGEVSRSPKSSENDVPSGSKLDLSFGDISSSIDCSSLSDSSEGVPKGMTTSTPMVPRVIKRRNLDVYSSSQDDEEHTDGGSDGLVTSTSVGTEASQQSGGRQLKKIKRRNQSIYTASEDDDNF